ncbi:cell division protein FtsX [Caldinitratiruptor microaerophilus]|uniref:Cell division protein FtsX n=1 Tax=Caldinitratiruptor microaerophilus TaxID=671077 RepID=A0AA35GBL2_9FIRM|nr:permease-like cell division protein FtsX [Caldinitratiruptor microaerophilus]BDG62434.1 hypothetical protein caldi_35240 [Caldinitratiruptor microaerophilus]
MRGDLTFPVREALLSIRLGGAVHALSVASIALSLFLVGLFTAAWLNLDHLVGLVRARAEITVYLKDGAPESAVESVRATLATRPGVRGVRRVSREEALAEMREVLGPEAAILAELEGANPFAAYLAVRVEPEAAPAVAAAAAGLPAVEYVQDNRELIGRLASLSRVATTAGLGLVAAAGVVALVVVSHVVRLSIHARRDEIETLRLIGASEGFVALPFLLEGVLTGGAGGALAALGLAGLLPLVGAALARTLPFLPLVPWAPVWVASAAVTVALGLLCGGLGSGIALRHRS